MQVVLYTISPSAVSDKVLHCWTSLGFVAVKDLIVGQYCPDLGLQSLLALTVQSSAWKVKRS